MNSDRQTKQLTAQMVRMKEESVKLRRKIIETYDYLHGNPHNAIAVSYWEPGAPHEGGFEFGNQVDFIYIGSVVETKYGAVLKVKGYDPEKDLLSFEGTNKKLDTSRISIVNSDEEPLRDLTPEEKFERIVADDITHQFGEDDDRPY